MTTIGSGWGEYQRLVLAELERHNKMISELLDSVNTISLQVALLKEENSKLAKLDQRVKLLEDQDIATAAVAKYRKWILSGFFLLATSIIIPIIKVIFFPGS